MSLQPGGSTGCKTDMFVDLFHDGVHIGQYSSRQSDPSRRINVVTIGEHTATTRSATVSLNMSYDRSTNVEMSLQGGSKIAVLKQIRQ